LVGLAAIVDEDNVDDSGSVGSSGGGIDRWLTYTANFRS
jgi:hypothetical protein